MMEKHVLKTVLCKISDRWSRQKTGILLLILNKAAHDWVQNADIQGNAIVTCAEQMGVRWGVKCALMLNIMPKKNNKDVNIEMKNK